MKVLRYTIFLLILSAFNTMASAQDLFFSCPNSQELDIVEIQEEFEGLPLDEIIDGFFGDWLGNFVAISSCNLTETDLSDITAPALSGGTVSVTFNATDECGNDETCTSTFTIIGDPSTTIILNCPEDLVLEDCSSQEAIDSAFNAWKSQFTFIAPLGSDLIATDLSVETAPNCGSSKTITFSVEDRSNPAITPVECTRTFVLPPAPLVNPLEGIPTVGEWGIIALVLILLSIAVVSLKSRSNSKLETS